MKRKLLVTGDRDWDNRECICSWLSTVQDLGYDELIQGEARGADTIAREEAERMGFTIIGRDKNTRGFPAEWDKYHLAAGPIRNQEMLDQKPDLVLAFHTDLSKSKGTADCVRKARRHKIEVIVVDGKEYRGEKGGSSLQG